MAYTEILTRTPSPNLYHSNANGKRHSSSTKKSEENTSSRKSNRGQSNRTCVEGHIMACNIFNKWDITYPNSQLTTNKDLAKIKTMATTEAMATNRVMANSTEQTVGNKDNATGYTSMEQILDTARRADRDQSRRESVPHWGLNCEIDEGVLEGEHQEQKGSMSAKSYHRSNNRTGERTGMQNTDLVITQVDLNNNRVTRSEELLKQMEDLCVAVQEKTSNHIMLGLLPRTMCRNQKYKDDKILYINRSLKTLSEKRGFTFLDLYWESEGKSHMSNNGEHLNRAGARTLGTCVSIATQVHFWSKRTPKPTAINQNSLPTSGNDDDDPAAAAT